MKQKVWLIDVNMGYGHQRTAYPLRSLAQKGEIINANAYQGIPEKDIMSEWNIPLKKFKDYKKEIGKVKKVIYPEHLFDTDYWTKVKTEYDKKARKYPGATPISYLENLLYYHTEQNDLVIDCFAE